MKLTDFDKVRELIDYHRSLKHQLRLATDADAFNLSFNGKMVTLSQQDDATGFADVKASLVKATKAKMADIEAQLRGYGVES